MYANTSDWRRYCLCKGVGRIKRKLVKFCITLALWSVSSAWILFSVSFFNSWQLFSLWGDTMHGFFYRLERRKWTCITGIASSWYPIAYPRFLMDFSSSFSNTIFSLSCWDTILSTWVQWAFCIMFWSCWGKTSHPSALTKPIIDYIDIDYKTKKAAAMLQLSDSFIL